jgi:hypothetical protein
MKSTRKHELQTNELADALGGIIAKARPHANIIGYAALAVVVLVTILVILPAIRGKGASAGAAMDAFAVAQNGRGPQPMRDFLTQFGDSALVPSARLLLANRVLEEAVSGESASNAPALLTEARNLYAQVAQTPSLEPLAQVGQALVTLQEGDLDKGRAALQEVMTKWPNSVAAAKAKANLEPLAGYKPVEFSKEPLEEPAAAPNK